MSKAGIDSIQSWLSSELERYGIDAVIYTRHVLDLLLNSRHTTDFQLAEKEANIFASLPPGSKNRKTKRKYNKRSRSLTYLDEISLKKEMAINCLRSASEKNPNVGNIKALINELYKRLNNFHLLSDASSSSDEGLIGERVERCHENYHDAFPLLHSDHHYKQNVKRVNSVWNGNRKFGTKNMCMGDSESNKKPIKEFQSAHGNNHVERKHFLNSHRKKQKCLQEESSSQEECSINISNRKQVKGKRNHNSGKLRYPLPIGFVPVSPSRCKKKNRNSKKQQFKDVRKFDKENVYDSRPFHNRKADKHKRKSELYHANAQQTGSFSINSCTTAYYRRVNATDDFSNFASSNRWKKRRSPKLIDEREISHLYSVGIEEVFKNNMKQETPRSKWFRDPQSGCLEFEPAYKSRNSSLASLSEEGLKEDEVSESWLWCPSPSLWEDSKDSSVGVAVSRLETAYRPNVSSDVSISEPALQECQGLLADISSFLPEICNHSTMEFKMESYEPTPFSIIVLEQDSKNPDLHSKESKNASSVWLCNAIPDSANDLIEDVFHAAQPYQGVLDGVVCETEDISNADLKDMKNEPLTKSRKDLWFQHAKEHPFGSEIDETLEAGHMSPHASITSWKESDLFQSLGFTNFYRANLMYDLLNDLSWERFDSSNLCWMSNLDISDQIGRECDLLPFESFSEYQKDEENDDICYAAKLVKSIVDVVAYADDQCFEEGVNDNISQSVKSSSISARIEQSQAKYAILPPIIRSHNDHHTKQSMTNSSSLADCVTENEAWKTSLRIGNIWQTISGIRPIDIVYSEKHQESDGPAVPQPSSLTHFRPIHLHDQDGGMQVSSSYHDQYPSESGCIIEQCHVVTNGCTDSASSPMSLTEQVNVAGGCDMWGLEMEIGKLLCEGSTAPDDCRLKLDSKLRRLRKDKSMQTTFEQQIWINNQDLRKLLCARPRKANSC